MKKIAELEAKLDGLKAEATAILNRQDAGNASAEDDQRLCELTDDGGEIPAVSAEIGAAKKRAAMRREMAPVKSAALSNMTDEPNPATTGGFKSLAEMAVAVRQAVVGGGTDQRLMAAPTNVHSAGGSDGEGFLVPSQFSEAIFEAVGEVDDFLGQFDLEPTSARSVEMNKDETTPWGSSGIQAAWRKEGSQMTPSKLALGGARVEIEDLSAFVAADEELMSDAPRLQNHIVKKAGQAIAYKAGDAILHGDGVGKPLGIMNSGALVTVSKEAGQSADTIVAANINKMYSRQIMVPGRRFWAANIDIFPQLQALAFGTDTPLYLPPGGLTSAPNGMLLGYPVVFTEHAKTLGDKGDDPDAYSASTVTTGWIAMKDFGALMAVVMAGTLGSSATLDAKFEQASDGSGTGAKDITGAAITQLTQAGTDSDKQAVINLRRDDLDMANDFTHVRLSMTVGTAASDAGAVVLAVDPNYAPASDNDASTVDEIVTI